jgi:hypothetical protein
MQPALHHDSVVLVRRICTPRGWFAPVIQRDDLIEFASPITRRSNIKRVIAFVCMRARTQRPIANCGIATLPSAAIDWNPMDCNGLH